MNKLWIIIFALALTASLVYVGSGSCNRSVKEPDSSQPSVLKGGDK